MDDARLTKHAVARIRERLGLPKRAAERELRRAVQGVGRRQCTGSLRRYLDALYHRHGDAQYRITPTAVFCFKDGSLVTVFLMPQRLRKKALAHWRKREDAPKDA